MPHQRGQSKRRRLLHHTIEPKTITATLPAPIHRAASTPLSIRALRLWHLLSLDAPTVATLWTWFVARTIHLRLPAVSLLAMFLAVWMLYAADRLLDATTSSPSNLEARHRFHRRYSPPFLTGILFTSITLAMLLPHLETSAIHLYLILGGLLGGYFILIHVAPNLPVSSQAAQRLPKESP